MSELTEKELCALSDEASDLVWEIVDFVRDEVLEHLEHDMEYSQQERYLHLQPLFDKLKIATDQMDAHYFILRKGTSSYGKP